MTLKNRPCATIGAFLDKKTFDAQKRKICLLRRDIVY